MISIAILEDKLDGVSRCAYVVMLNWVFVLSIILVGVLI